MKKNIPTKGEPDFTSVSDAKLKEYINLIQQLIFSYQEDKEKHSVLTEMWKQLSNEQTERSLVHTEEEVCKETPMVVHKVKVVKRIKR